jgi:zinc protease
MKKLLFATAAICLAGTAAFAQPKLVETVTKKGDEIVIPYQKYVLPNGLTVVLTEDHSDPLVHVDVTYHVGSAREEIGKSGFAHFFEHMMFQGSDNVADEQHFKIISGAGGTLNGSTNQDRTNYFETVPSNQLEKMLWLESDRMGFLLDAVTQKKFEVQRSTVKNERGQNYDNRPYGLAGEFTSKNLYPYGHPYSWLTIGYIEDLNRVNVQDLKNFFLRWYGPNNATITIGGDIKPAEAIKLVDKYFGSIPRGPEVTKTILAPVVIESDRYASYTDNYAKLPVLSKTFATVPNYDKDMAALACLAQVLGQGKNSVFYQQLVKTQKALNASASSRLSELAGEFNFQITPFPGKSLGSMDSLLTNALASFEQRGVTDEDVAKFKGGIESQFINGLQSVSGKVSQLAAFQTFTGTPNMIGKQLAMYRAVTKEDVMNAYNKYIKGKHSITVSILVKNQDAQPVQADNYVIDQSKYVKPNYGYDALKYVKATDKFDRTKQPGAGANPVVKVPAFWKSSLPNGIKVIGAANNELPVVNISVKIPGGQLAEEGMPAKSGVASITAAMLNEDTKKYTAEQMAAELQKLGSNISISSSFDGMNYTVSSLKANLSKTMDLLEERMLHPNFTEASFNRIQKQALEGFKQQKAQPASIADKVYDNLTYGNEILGMSSNGTEATIKALTLKDVQDFYSSHLSAPGTRVVVVGDVKETDVLPELTFLNSLSATSTDTKKPAPGVAVGKTIIYLVDVPKAAQTEFRVGMPTNVKYDATGEFYRLGLLNYTIGGDFNSRLNINLREDKGWTYGARSSFTGDEYQGFYTFSAGIRADATDSALVEVIKEIKNYAANGITPEELAFMKQAIGQRDALAYETGAQKSAFVGRILQYNLPANFVETQSSILQNMKKSEIDALAKKWLDVNKMNILLVGDKAKILPGLQKLGYEIVELDADGNKK